MLTAHRASEDVRGPITSADQFLLTVPSQVSTSSSTVNHTYTECRSEEGIPQRRSSNDLKEGWGEQLRPPQDDSNDSISTQATVSTQCNSLVLTLL